MSPLAAGQTLSHYRILETLGQGGQATAYKAEDLRLSRPVVIKTLRPELAASETARRRFGREACLCSVLDNPNIQAVYDVGESDGLYFIVMQYVEGPTLRHLMTGRPFETLFALSIGIQIADALAVAHAHGIVTATSSRERDRDRGARRVSTSVSPRCSLSARKQRPGAPAGAATR
jgi:serine/threonine protein kinase